MSIKSDVVKEYLQKYPELTNTGLAKLIYKDNIKLFIDTEDARSFVRLYRGAKGKQKREQLVDRRYIEKLNIPPSEPNKREVFIIKEDIERIAVISDIHIPHHDEQALSACINYIKKFKPNAIVLLGDVVDCFAVSVFNKDPRECNFDREIHLSKHFLQYLRQEFPDQLIVYQLANHEARYEHYMFRKAPELLGCSVFEMSSLLDLSRYNILPVKQEGIIKFGHLSLLHGDKLNMNSGGVNISRTSFLKSISNVLIGHFHRTTTFTQKTLSGKYLSSYSIGCLCNMNPKYAPHNAWNHGFATIEKTDGYFKVNNLQIINGVVV